MPIHLVEKAQNLVLAYIDKHIYYTIFMFAFDEVLVDFKKVISTGSGRNTHVRKLVC